MIKFVRIGNQIEEGKYQFAFYFFGLDKDGKYAAEFVNPLGEQVFDNIEHFRQLFYASSGTQNDLWCQYSFDDFKYIMPPEMLPKEDKQSNEDHSEIFSRMAKIEEELHDIKLELNKTVDKQKIEPSEEIHNIFV